jgi:hypothetical protein
MDEGPILEIGRGISTGVRVAIYPYVLKAKNAAEGCVSVIRRSYAPSTSPERRAQRHKQLLAEALKEVHPKEMAVPGQATKTAAQRGDAGFACGDPLRSSATTC